MIGTYRGLKTNNPKTQHKCYNGDMHRYMLHACIHIYIYICRDLGAGGCQKDVISRGW